MENLVTMKESPYLVEPYEDPQQAIKFALKKGLLENFNINKDLINNYLDSKSDLPIWILDATCLLNKEDTIIPVKYQYLWFCLNKVNVKRFLPNGKMFNPEVKFHTVYIEPSNKIIVSIKKALAIIRTKKELGRLCSVKRQTIYQWINKKVRPTLIGLLKICQILNMNIWTLIDNQKLYSKSENEFLTFKNYLKMK